MLVHFISVRTHFPYVALAPELGDSYAGSGKGPMTLTQGGKNEDVFNMQNRVYEVK